MWILEVEDVRSHVKEWTFDAYSELDRFFQKYLRGRGLKEQEKDRMFTLSENDSTEQGELYFFDSGVFHGNYCIREAN